MAGMGSIGAATSSTGAALVEAADEYVAPKPSMFTELSEVNAMCMLPSVAVTAPGTTLPVNDPSSAAPLLVLSYIFTKSKPCSVVKLLNIRVTGLPVEIVHEHAWLEE